MPHLTADANFTIMRLYNFPDDCQPQPCSMAITPSAGWIDLIKPIKETWQRLFRDADA